MPKMVCVKCKLQYKILRNGALVIEMCGNHPEPYRMLESDAWFCPGCSHVVLTGMPEHGIEHYQPNFEDLLKRELESKRFKDGWVIYVYEKKTDVPVSGKIFDDGYDVDDQDITSNPFFRGRKCRRIVPPSNFAEHREKCGYPPSPRTAEDILREQWIGQHPPERTPRTEALNNLDQALEGR